MRAGHEHFRANSHEQMIYMLATADVPSVRQGADLWRQAARTLAERSAEIQQQLDEFSPSWAGGAADQYKMMMAELVEGIANVSELVGVTRDLTYSAAECLAQAQARMPSAVEVPVLGAAARAFAPALDARSWKALPTAQQTGLTQAWETMTPDQQQRVVGEIEHRERMVDAAATAKAEAEATMMELAVQYTVIQEAVPELPLAGHPPQVPSNPALAQTVADRLARDEWPVISDFAAGEDFRGDSVGSEPLFGDMYAAGSLAAGAAVLGRFGLGNDWLATHLDPVDGDGSDPADDGSDGGDGSVIGGGLGKGALAGAALGAAGVAAGLGSKVGGIGGGIGGSSSSDAAKANPALTGSGLATSTTAASRLMATLGSAPGMSGGPAGMRGGMPMGGMMPMMGGAGEGSGMGRRPPTWLLEREPVFGGESVPVTPAVIGEEPAEPPSRATRRS